MTTTTVLLADSDVDVNPEYMVPSNPVDRQKIKLAIQEAANSLMRIDAERDLMKEAGKALKEEFEMPTSVFNQLSRVHHKRNLEEKKNQTEALTDNYSLLFSGE